MHTVLEAWLPQSPKIGTITLHTLTVAIH